MVKLDREKHVGFRLTLDVVLSWAELIMFTFALLLNVAKLVGCLFFILFIQQTELINV